MSAGEIAGIIGIVASLGGGVVWAVRLVARVTVLIETVKTMQVKHAELETVVRGFREEFHQYFLRSDRDTRQQWERMEVRLDKIERGMLVFIAKNGGTLPDVGE